MRKIAFTAGSVTVRGEDVEELIVSMVEIVEPAPVSADSNAAPNRPVVDDVRPRSSSTFVPAARLPAPVTFTRLFTSVTLSGSAMAVASNVFPSFHTMIAGATVTPYSKVTGTLSSLNASGALTVSVCVPSAGSVQVTFTTPVTSDTSLAADSDPPFAGTL